MQSLIRLVSIQGSAWLVITASLACAAEPVAPAGGALAGQRPRIIISTDIGGSDPDDFQSFVHLLLYANQLDIEGLVSSPPQAGRAKHILEVLKAYEADYANLQKHSSDFPKPEALRRVTRQGAIEAAPQKGWSNATAGSKWISARAMASDKRPLWVLVWGSITDVAQAVHDDPSIKSKLRVYSIGSWNTGQDRAAREYLFKNHTDLWWIESDTTFRGMYTGGKQDGSWGNRSFVDAYVKNQGALGDLFYSKKRDIKMGDTPSLLYLLRGKPDEPATEHWGGAFVKTSHGPAYWTDTADRSLAEGGRAGARTVSKWRIDYLSDWRKRMAWASNH